MRIAHLSDLHLGANSPGDYQGAGRLKSLRRALQELAKEAIDAILLAGDVFDGPHVETAIVETVARALEGATAPGGNSIPVVLVPGNHDPSDSTNLWSKFRDSLGSSNVRLVLEPELIELADGKLLIEAYPCQSRYSPECPWTNRVVLTGKTEQAIRVVMAHGTLQGGPVPEGEMDAYPFDAADLQALQADYVALGHFHGVYPAWDGGEEIQRSFCYCGTHEPKEFNSDSGWAIIASLEKGRPARLRRLRVGLREWRLLQVSGLRDFPALDELRVQVERDADPGRFVIRVKVAAQAQLSPEEAGRLESFEKGSRVLGAHVERQGELQTCVNVEALDLDGLPSGAVKQTLVSLRQELASTTEARQREVVAAALQLGWEQFEREGA